MISIEETIIGWVGRTAGIAAHAAPPRGAETPFATVELIAGSTSVGISRPSVAVQFWAGSRAVAEEVARKCASSACARLAADIPSVAAVSVDGPYSLPDPETRMQRYQIILDLTLTE